MKKLSNTEVYNRVAYKRRVYASFEDATCAFSNICNNQFNSL